MTKALSQSFGSTMMTKRRFLAFLGASMTAQLIAGGAHAQTATTSVNQRVAVVYFSESGNTKSLAESVANFKDADLFRIEPVEPYPSDYQKSTEVVKYELDNNIVRSIKPVTINVDDYDVFVLLSPTWWHHIAQPLQTWIKSVDLSGKLVLTANTHGGGGLMHTREDFEALLPNSRLGTHFTTYGSVRKNSSFVRTWLRENELIK